MLEILGGCFLVGALIFSLGVEADRQDPDNKKRWTVPLALTGLIIAVGPISLYILWVVCRPLLQLFF